MSCNYGFSGNNVTARCTGLNTWSEKTPTCTSKICRSKQLNVFNTNTALPWIIGKYRITKLPHCCMFFLCYTCISFIKINLYFPAFNGVLMMNIYYTHLFQCTGHAILWRLLQIKQYVYRRRHVQYRDKSNNFVPFTTFAFIIRSIESNRFW